MLNASRLSIYFWIIAFTLSTLLSQSDAGTPYALIFTWSSTFTDSPLSPLALWVTYSRLWSPGHSVLILIALALAIVHATMFTHPSLLFPSVTPLIDATRYPGASERREISEGIIEIEKQLESLAETRDQACKFLRDLDIQARSLRLDW